MYNLLTDPLIRFNHSNNGTVQASLPEVYAALMADEVEAFPALRPHQRHAWHAFLVQLGAITMHRAGLSNPPGGAGEWRRVIRALTEDEFPDDEPWRLLVEDITKPAFMQPAAGTWENYKKEKEDQFFSPDSLDMLDTAKNHDLKKSVAIRYELQDWVFALITMQTINGQVGRGNYPIARMNSGDGSRTAFSVTPSLRFGVHVHRDIMVLLNRSSEVEGILQYRWDGISLLWTKQWDGQRELIPIPRLHPLFIEICRRRRLRIDFNGNIYGMKAASKGRLISAATFRGVVGDPWTLVTNDNKGLKALTMQTDSFNYKNVRQYLTSPDWSLPTLFWPTHEEINRPFVYLIMRGIRRKKGGQTERYHERIIPFRRKSIQVFGRPGDPGQLGDITRERVEQIGKVQSILKYAIATFAAHGDSKKAKELLTPRKQNDLLRKRVDEIVGHFEEKIDYRFFGDLQDEFEAPLHRREKIRDDWFRNFVIPSAKSALLLAHHQIPIGFNDYFRSQATSQNVFLGSVNRDFPMLFDTEVEEELNAC